MGLSDAEVENIKLDNKRCEEANFEILKRWRESSGGHVKKLHQIFSLAIQQDLSISPEALKYLISTPVQGMFKLLGISVKNNTVYS